MSIPAASGCTTSKLTSSAWIFLTNSRRCFRFMRCTLSGALPTAAAVAFSCFPSRVLFMLCCPGLLRSRLGPVGETYTIFPAGSSRVLFQGPRRRHPHNRQPPEPRSSTGTKRHGNNGLSCRAASIRFYALLRHPGSPASYSEFLVHTTIRRWLIAPHEDIQ